MHYTGKYCDLYPYTDEYESLKSVQILQAAKSYVNPDNLYTTILILDEVICMG